MHRNAGVAIAARKYERDVSRCETFRDQIDWSISDVDIKDGNIRQACA